MELYSIICKLHVASCNDAILKQNKINGVFIKAYDEILNLLFS